MESCTDCTTDKTCETCQKVEQQSDEISTTMVTLSPEIQMIALGIVAGLQQITEDDKESIGLFITKVNIKATAYPEIKGFLENITKCYLTPWQYVLAMRCLQSLNVTASNPSENAS